jgi:hypothetical protein
MAQAEFGQHLLRFDNVLFIICASVSMSPRLFCTPINPSTVTMPSVSATVAALILPQAGLGVSAVAMLTGAFLDGAPPGVSVC